MVDPRIEVISASVQNDSARWKDAIARQTVLELFPNFVSVERLSDILRRLKVRPSTADALTYRLPHEIKTASLSPEYTDQLRQELTKLILDGITWETNKFPHLQTKRPDLLPALIATCRCQAAEGIRSEPWILSSLLAVRLSGERSSEKDALAVLLHVLEALTADTRENAFWKEEAFLASLHQSQDAWGRVWDLSHHGGIQLNEEKDGAWVRKRLSDSSEPLDHREMMLWTEMLLFNRVAPDHRERIEVLKPFVADAPSLIEIIDNRLKPQKVNADLRRMEAANARRIKQAGRQAVKAHASWVMFWREIAENPDAAFAKGRAEHTAWNLWQALDRSGRESRASGWNRRFIEEQFDKAVADRLRETMMVAWRRDRPTLRSERPGAEKSTFLVRWQFGLAGVAAESEDANWAKRLTVQEA